MINVLEYQTRNIYILINLPLDFNLFKRIFVEVSNVLSNNFCFEQTVIKRKWHFSTCLFIEVN